MTRLRSTSLLVALLLALLALAGCGGDDGGDGGASTGDAAATVDENNPTGIPSCPKVDAPAPKTDAQLRKPTGRLDPGKTWTAVVQTNCGSFRIELDVARAPKTAASFASLARKGFYDGLAFHRIAPGFVIQGGDPLGNGSGGPGYTVVEKPPKDIAYTHGVVAMAKTATDPDGASGSQFFVVLGEDIGLPPQFALLGKVVEGLDVVDKIGAVQLESSDPQGSAPLEPVVIETVEIASR